LVTRLRSHFRICPLHFNLGTLRVCYLPRLRFHAVWFALARSFCTHTRTARDSVLIRAFDPSCWLRSFARCFPVTPHTANGCRLRARAGYCAARYILPVPSDYGCYHYGWFAARSRLRRVFCVRLPHLPRIVTLRLLRTNVAGYRIPYHGWLVRLRGCGFYTAFAAPGSAPVTRLLRLRRSFSCWLRSTFTILLPLPVSWFRTIHSGLLTPILITAFAFPHAFRLRLQFYRLRSRGWFSFGSFTGLRLRCTDLRFPRVACVPVYAFAFDGSVLPDSSDSLFTLIDWMVCSHTFCVDAFAHSWLRALRLRYRALLDLPRATLPLPDAITLLLRCRLLIAFPAPLRLIYSY